MYCCHRVSTQLRLNIYIISFSGGGNTIFLSTDTFFSLILPSHVLSYWLLLTDLPFTNKRILLSALPKELVNVTMNVEAAGSSEISVTAHKAQRCHNLHRCKNFVISKTRVSSLNLTNTITDCSICNSITQNWVYILNCWILKWVPFLVLHYATAFNFTQFYNQNCVQPRAPSF
jgi:hypothetical protein